MTKKQQNKTFGFCRPFPRLIFDCTRLFVFPASDRPQLDAKCWLIIHTLT